MYDYSNGYKNLEAMLDISLRRKFANVSFLHVII